jgi:hypothetical protein
MSCYWPNLEQGYTKHALQQSFCLSTVVSMQTTKQLGAYEQHKGQNLQSALFAEGQEEGISKAKHRAPQKNTIR